jgi:hypothetical protein
VAPPFSQAWLDDDPRPLDWNGPANRLSSPFREQDLHRPIFEHFERVARQHCRPEGQA